MIVIPAQKGSVRCPGKNTADIHGKPMFEWVLLEALKARKEIPHYELMAVVTDDERVCDIVKRYADVPMELLEMDRSVAGDGVPLLAEHIHGQYGMHVYQVIQVTTPLATAADYMGAFMASHFQNVNIATVTEDRETKTWRRNGACYVWRAGKVSCEEWMTGPTAMYVMPPERSVDVNTPEDLERVRELWNR